MTLALPESMLGTIEPAATAGPVDLTPEQVRVLLMGMAENRVQHLKGNAHTEAWDIRRWLTRIFGFGGWGDETLELVCVREMEIKPGRWTVIYRAQVRLTVRTADGRLLGSWDDAAMGDSQNQPQLGSAHDQAMKTALSQGLKRCAVNLGDQFGLSLYNNGSAAPVVLKSVAHPSPATEGAPLVPEQDAPVQPEPSPDPVPEQQPQRSDRAEGGQWETPAPAAAERAKSVDTAPHRDYIAEARAARTPQEFAATRASAVAAGCSDEYAEALDRIAEQKRAAAQQQRAQESPDPTSTTAGSGTTAVGVTGRATVSPPPEPDALPGAPDGRRSIGLALSDMLTAGADVGVNATEVRRMFVDRYGHGAQDGTVAELRNVEADLKAVVR